MMLVTPRSALILIILFAAIVFAVAGIHQVDVANVRNGLPSAFHF